MLNNFIRVFILYLVISFSNFGNAYIKLFEPEIPDNIDINISWKYLKKYSDYINTLNLNPRSNIPSKFKDNFKSKIYFENKDNKLTILPSTARITGDWQDHIHHQKKNFFIKSKS